jgi:diketogulonate reductase-like aldo/keto reductase
MQIPALDLNDGTSLPAIGFGTYPLRGGAAEASVTDALNVGYRLIDTAVNYGNETEVGRAVAAAPKVADSVVVTTKIPGRDHGYDATMRSCEQSLERLGRIDLYLIHWPMPRLRLFVDTWRAMVDLRAEGRVRSIGVSNFTERHLVEIIDATGVVPVVNQVELHPELPQTALRQFHADHGIVTESWSPLGEARTFTAPAVLGLARKYDKTPAQIVLRWHVQLGAVPLPKSRDAARRRENAGVFDFTLTDSEMSEITSLGDAGARLWDGDPNTNEEF